MQNKFELYCLSTQEIILLFSSNIPLLLEILCPINLPWLFLRGNIVIKYTHLYTETLTYKRGPYTNNYYHG